MGNYYICEDCKVDFFNHFFLWLDNDTWALISGKQNTLLCGHCILDRISEKGFAYGRLILGENNEAKFQKINL